MRQPLPSARVWTENLVLPTYLPASPDKNPMFLERRVYQGSSGRVYPLPFTDRVAEVPVARGWKAVWLENPYLRVLVLPELGGRIHRIVDRTNGYDLIYHQPVIKPALVGLAGPWVSGGIEFNWPQHHRPGTFLPVDTEIEEHADGSVTVWCGDHDPMTRMKGLHGVCLHPGRAVLELKVRVYNRTPLVQTFLWWANVATRVHEDYQSFFPPDVRFVADHARRSTSRYPLADGRYYGVDYAQRGLRGIPRGERPRLFVPWHCRSATGPRVSEGRSPAYAPNDLSFYANIPVPTSYMAVDSQGDFCGGYDHRAQAGLVHVANHHVSPGKKQWTWGNHEFGYAWDRNLTDADASGERPPYIELMAGVYTDNQPDFSFLQPGETKVWSQYWYPIQEIGPPEQANVEAALSVRIGKQFRVGVCVTRPWPRATLRILLRGKEVRSVRRAFVPGAPVFLEAAVPRGLAPPDWVVRLVSPEGREIISCEHRSRQEGPKPEPATEPPAAPGVPTVDELYLTGLHLEQYRHATRSPTVYWSEGLRHDPLDTRCNLAMGRWHLKCGEFDLAENHFRNAIQRLTRRNPNPYDGEPFYQLGLCLRHQGREEEAYRAFYKATWNQAWAAAGYHALAEIDCAHERWTDALAHLDRSLAHGADNLRARDLKVLVLRELGRAEDAVALLGANLALDRLDYWALHLSGEPLGCDLQARLDVAHDYARAGFLAEAVGVLREAVGWARTSRGMGGTTGRPDVRKGALPDQSWGALPLVYYTLGWLEQRLGNHQGAKRLFRRGAMVATDYCFPARLEEIAVLRSALAAFPRDARASYYLGNLFCDRRRHDEAIRLWQQSARLDPHCSLVWRNLGMAYFNVRGQAQRARVAYQRAIRANPRDARLLYERDQLGKRLGEQPARRLRALENRMDLVRQRDDLSVEFCALQNQVGQPDKALAVLRSRRFQPWEGGEGGALGQYVRSMLALGQAALGNAESCGPDEPEQSAWLEAAVEDFRQALATPENLGEARHPLANASDGHYWLGCALERSGAQQGARAQWREAAASKGDFQEMTVRAFSEMSFFSALAADRLGRGGEARERLRKLLAYARALEKTPASTNYFVTSLPNSLWFEEDSQARQQTGAWFLQAQARLGLGERAAAESLLRAVLDRDPNHAAAADLTKALASATLRSFLAVRSPR